MILKAEYPQIPQESGSTLDCWSHSFYIFKRCLSKWILLIYEYFNRQNAILPKYSHRKLSRNLFSVYREPTSIKQLIFVSPVSAHHKQVHRICPHCLSLPSSCNLQHNWYTWSFWICLFSTLWLLTALAGFAPSLTLGKALKTLWEITGLLGPDKEIQLQVQS